MQRDLSESEIAEILALRASGTGLVRLAVQTGHGIPVIRRVLGLDNGVAPLRMPRPNIQSPVMILDYAPDSASELARWLRLLPRHQCRRVWKALVIEQKQEVNLSAVVAMLQVVDDRLISVEKVGANGLAHEH